MPVFQPSSEDKVAFSREVQRRAQQVFGEYQRRGKDLTMPASLLKSAYIMRYMHERYAAGDNRHSVEEMQAEQDVARWLVDSHHALNGTSPPPTTWDKFGEDRRT